ncbi:MAG: methylated-DNA--[protein]-cysteine S-methyltransferase [Clostridiales bacterium]|jgi:methylated-DNA-[protein]-cysteine S-methyltransferase|nr:methylated-DNA--[protein]-cysteine S-methyltransferase [Clostridiales bacterium]
MEYTYNSPIGPLLISYDDNFIRGAHFDREQTQETVQNPLILRAIEQLDQYFAGKLQDFDLPLKPAGTDFQRRVWAQLCGIAYGETRSYGQVAAAIGQPKASRAVGGANNKNPIIIMIPCHRVIGADGKLVGYGGGMERKIWLLDHENNHNIEQTNLQV